MPRKKLEDLDKPAVAPAPAPKVEAKPDAVVVAVILSDLSVLYLLQ